MTLPSILLRPQIAFKYKIETQTFLDVASYKAISKMMEAVISQGWMIVFQRTQGWTIVSRRTQGWTIVFQRTRRATGKVSKQRDNLNLGIVLTLNVFICWLEGKQKRNPARCLFY